MNTMYGKVTIKLNCRLDYFSVLFLSQLNWKDVCEKVHKIINLVKIANYQPKLLSSFLDEEIKSSLLDGSWLGGDSQNDGSCDDFQPESLEIIPVVRINIRRLRLGVGFSEKVSNSVESVQEIPELES